MTKEWQAVVQLTSSAACAKHARVVLTPVDSFAVRALIWKRTCAGAIRPGHKHTYVYTSEDTVLLALALVSDFEQVHVYSLATATVVTVRSSSTRFTVTVLSASVAR